MREVGQYLTGPGALLNTPAPEFLAGLIALGVTLSCTYRCVCRPFFPALRWRLALAVGPLLALAGMAAVLLLQLAALRIYLNADLNTTIRYFYPGPLPFLLNFLALILGMGYAESLAPRSFGEHIFSFVAGVGLLEELVKGLLGMLLACLVILGGSEPRPDARKPWLLAYAGVAFLAAGMTYGAGEAIYYFQVYAGEGAPWWAYLVRAVWCVCLHGAWGAFTGVLAGLAGIAYHGMEKEPAPPSPAPWDRIGEAQLDARLALGAGIMLCLPAAILHGLYDAACLHDNTIALMLGGVSLAACPILLALLAYLGRAKAAGVLPFLRAQSPSVVSDNDARRIVDFLCHPDGGIEDVRHAQRSPCWPHYFI
jgi:hypothetical protein